MKKAISPLFFALALVMLSALFPSKHMNALAAEMSQVTEQTVTYEDISAEIFRYTPADLEFCGNNTPLIFVLSDETYTAETAENMLNANGFKEIADKESCSVIFVSPKNGESWTKDDYAVMQVLAGNTTDDYYIGTDYSAGIDENGYFYASRWRHYVFAEGSAAAFAKTMLETEDASYFMPQWTAWVDGFGAGFVYAEDGFTAANVTAGWEKVRCTTRLYNNERISFLAPYYYWKEEGINETRETIKLEYEDIPELEYYLYVPDTVDLDSTAERYPLLLAFHGNALHPLAHIQNTRWPLVAKENKFVVVAVNGLYNTTSNADAIADLVDHMINNYSIDASRVYCTGYSKGTMETMNFAEHYTEKLAGMGLFEPVYGYFPVYQPSTTIPVYAILGQEEFFPVFPKDTEKATESLNAIGKVNGFTYTYNEDLGEPWGYTFDLNESLRLPEDRGVMHIHSIASEKDGIVYTKVVDAYNLGHNVFPHSAWEMWDFLSQFSRSAEGAIVVNEKNPYADVTRDSWYYYAVRAAVKAGLFQGTSANIFAPNDKATPAMLVTALYRMADMPGVAGGSSFAGGSWYEPAAAWAGKNGIISYDSNFAADIELTEEDAVAVLSRYAESCGIDADAGIEYAKQAVRQAAEAGGDLSAAAAPLTRAQSAVMLLYFADLIAENGIA